MGPDLRILVPMVTLREDMKRARAHLPAFCVNAIKAEAVPTLLRLGVRNLSVAPPLLSSVKEAVRDVDLSKV